MNNMRTENKAVKANGNSSTDAILGMGMAAIFGILALAGFVAVACGAHWHVWTMVVCGVLSLVSWITRHEA